MSRSTRMAATLAIALGVGAASAQAQTPAPAPAVDPAAVAALDRMSAYLRTLKAFHVVADTTTDDVLDDGQKIQYGATVSFAARMPDKLLVEVKSDLKDRQMVYDGKSFTLYARRVGYYATVPAPATLKELDDVLLEKYDIEVPLADLFRWGSAKWSASDLVAAGDFGPSDVGGTSCQHYAFRQEGVDFELWIQKGDFPLPRRLVITTTDDASRPQHAATYTWNLAPSINDAAFTFVPPSTAHKIVMAEAAK